MRLRKLILAAVVAVATAGVLSGGSTALAEPLTDPEPWQPYRSADFLSPAGRSCDFDLNVQAIEDEEEYRVDARYPDGTEKLVEYRGKLITRFTNLATGESTVRDNSGHAWVELYPDGVTMKSFTGIGPFGMGFRATDTYPRGYYRLDGLHQITMDSDGTRHMTIATGTQENICHTLG
ncbi:hypothetical protein [Actinophytocola sediminis]